MAVLEVRNFKKMFGDKVVHRGVTFKVEKGECLGLMGGSGSGKSVILRSLIGLEKPDDGNIFVEGVDIAKFNEKQLVEIRRKVAYVFQGGALFDSMTVFENLAYPLREHTEMNENQIKDRVFEQLAEFGMDGNEYVFPSQLSGGMQKRVGLARAIITKPEIILYDEPTAGLDPYNTKIIQELILRLKKKGVTSIFVSHDMPSALVVCDRISLLVEGRIKAEGLKKDLSEMQDSPIGKFMLGEEF
jgi:phospholipid/cholesterol/gamma-HCH transport system ATP-binding protein